MENLLNISVNLVHNVSTHFTRSMADRISWRHPLIGIRGARGVGKTTLLLQHLRHSGLPNTQKLYVSLDEMYFTEHSLLEMGERFAQQGGQLLALDEVHKYPSWAREIKNLHDRYADLQIIYNGSSILDMAQQEGHLSRRALMYELSALSFREFLDFKHGIKLPILTLEQVLSPDFSGFDVFPSAFKPYQFFDSYLRTGYYPFAKGPVQDYYRQLRQLVRMVVEYDMAEVKGFDIRQAKKLLQLEFQKAMLQDSIAKAEGARSVQEAHEAEMLHEAKTRKWSIAGGVFALLLAAGFYIRWRYVQKSKTALQTEKDRSDNLLLNILPEEIAQELKEKGKADARDFDQVSILFTDFKSFTEHSEKLSAAEVVNELNHCFKAFDGTMEKYGIEKIKTIGDAYMAAGGLPVPTDDSVKNTILAALEMQGFIEERRKTKEEIGEMAFEMRVGIHTGPVVAGIVGVKKFQYDIWGDTVNTASRMESAGKVGKVNISQSTYELIKDEPEFVFESRGKIKAKGKGEIEMYFVSKA